MRRSGQGYEWWELSHVSEGLPRPLQSEDETHQLFGRVGDSHVIMLALSSLFSQVGGKGRFPEADILCGVEKGIAQIAGAAFLHVGISAIHGELSGLVCRR